MMMTVRSSGISRLRFVPLALALGALALVILFGTSLAPHAREVLVNMLGNRATVDAYAGFSRDELALRLAEAETELARTRYQALLYTQVVDENMLLRNAASLVESFAKSIPARIVARPPRTHYDTLILDVGKNANVVENDLVVYNGAVLGRIVSVGTSTALAELFSTPGSERDVILGEPHAVAIAKGLGGGAFEVALPKGVAVAPGDVVRIPYPEILVLGVVVSFSGDDSDATKIVRFRSPVSMYELDFVTVVSAQP